MAAPDTSSSRLVLPAGTLPSGDTLYEITLTAAKGSGAGARSDSDSAVVRVLATAEDALEPPTGQITRWCPGSATGACSSKKHIPSEPLRLRFVLDDPTLTAATTFAWNSSDVALSSPGVVTSLSKQVSGWRPAATCVRTICPPIRIVQRPTHPLRAPRTPHHPQALVIQPFTTAGATVFADGSSITINCTATAGEVKAQPG